MNRNIEVQAVSTMNYFFLKLTRGYNLPDFVIEELYLFLSNLVLQPLSDDVKQAIVAELDEGPYLEDGLDFFKGKITHACKVVFSHTYLDLATKAVVNLYSDLAEEIEAERVTKQASKANICPECFNVIDNFEGSFSQCPHCHKGISKVDLLFAYKIPVEYASFGEVEVFASSLADAYDQLEKDEDRSKGGQNFSLPEGDYIDGSFKCSCSSLIDLIDYLKKTH